MERENVGFVMYRDYMEYVGFLSSEEKAEVLDAILAYAFCGTVAKDMSRMSSLVFAFMKNQIDRDHDKYEKKCEKNRKNALLGGRPAKKEEARAEVTEEARAEVRTEVKTEAREAAAPEAVEEKAAESVEVTPEIEEQFAEFFEEYPKKTCREEALLEYARLRPDADLHRRIMVELRSARTYPKWIKENGRYVPRASVWLSRREWELNAEEKKKYRIPDPFSFDTEDFFTAAIERGEQFG